QAAEPERALAALALGPIVGDADLLVAERGDVAPQIRVLVSIEKQDVEHTAIDQAKVAGVGRQGVVAEPGDGAIENAPHGVKEKRFRPRPAYAVDDLRTRLPLPDEIEDEIGRVLQIAVDLGRGIATGETIAGEDRALKPEIPRETINPHPGIAGSQ